MQAQQIFHLKSTAEFFPPRPEPFALRAHLAGRSPASISKFLRDFVREIFEATTSLKRLSSHAELVEAYNGVKPICFLEFEI